MIYEALHSVVKELNTYLKKKFSVQDERAILNTLLNQDGSITEQGLNKIVLSLINLEQDTNIPYNPIYQTQGSNAEQLYTPFNFNLDVLITALYENANYDEGLKFLSEAIYFFQGKQVFNHSNTPNLDPRIDVLAFELIKLSYHEEHSIWTAMGAKYMPSVLFKIRILSFQSGTIIENIPVVKHTKPTTELK